jgi:hypothetical protein
LSIDEAKKGDSVIILEHSDKTLIGTTTELHHIDEKSKLSFFYTKEPGIHWDLKCVPVSNVARCIFIFEQISLFKRYQIGQN